MLTLIALLLTYTSTLWLCCYLLGRTPLTRRLIQMSILLAIITAVIATQILLWQAETTTEPTLPLWLQNPLLLIGTGLLVLAMGYFTAVTDAKEKSETLFPDLLISLDATLVAGLLFASPIALTMAYQTGITPSMLLLLLINIAFATAIQVFDNPIQSAVDRLSIYAFPKLRQERTNLRATIHTLPKIDDSLDPNTLDEDELARLTRRALSHYGDLSRLTASPLTRLSIVQKRLKEQHLDESTLARATILKGLLAEAIEQLKPQDGSAFNTQDTWRHYNALYFPYVVGLRPYSRRAKDAQLDEPAQQALAWFRTYVPERTLYNWQNAAARLVAQYIRERSTE